MRVSAWEIRNNDFDLDLRVLVPLLKWTEFTYNSKHFETLMAVILKFASNPSYILIQMLSSKRKISIEIQNSQFW